MAFRPHRNRWPWMTLNSHFALNTIFRLESFSVDALFLRRDCFKIDGRCAYTVSSRNVARGLFSGDIRLMPIFVGIRWWGDVKWECCRRKCEFSPSIAISSTWSFPLALYIEIYPASPLARFPCNSTALVTVLFVWCRLLHEKLLKTRAMVISQTRTS